MRIAIVEAEPVAADILAFVAQRRGHQPLAVPSVQRLFERLPFEPNAVVLSAPDLDGESLAGIKRVRERFPAATVLVLAEHPRGLAPAEAIRAGAHDVVRSPYNPYEVLLRLENWNTARPAPAKQTGGIRLADLEIDLDLYASNKAGRKLPLTKLERRLLYCLCQHYPNLAPIERLLAFGWQGADEPDSALLKTHISHIRKKLRDAGGVPFEITSLQTIGYQLVIDEAAAKAS